MRAINRLPTVPEYYQDFINPNVDLTEHPKQCCPLHEENTPSFSYDLKTGKCSCFGRCHAYGMDVIELHRRRMHYKDQHEARINLCKLYNIDVSEIYNMFDTPDPIDEYKVELKTLMYKANLMAKTVDRQLELDYVMSISPIETDRIQNLLNKWYDEEG